ncbi:MAG: SDR family NAD(P)-dependent oxidoreductase [Gammaproteobacteria bacterium]|nr:SDR family NAD(P)-dependent oxidoreductase [Gammaproteobacteria bacterium]
MAAVGKVLVTGSEGFIGSHLVETLVRDGYQVRAFVLYNSFNSWGWLEDLSDDVKRQIEIVTGDVRDPLSVRMAMQGCSAVMHLAALIAIPYSYTAPTSYVDTNVTGTLNVVQAARELGIEKVIHTSTSECYGTAQFVPITEEHPLQPQSPYSASKIAADQIALSYYYSFDLPVTIIRPFNTYGPRQSARAVIPTVITQIANGVGELKLGALSPTRDFNYVKDTAQGFVAALRADKVAGEVINIGSNFEVSIGDAVSHIADIMQAEVNITTDEQRIRPEKSEVNRLWAANDKAKKMLDWQPQYGGLDGFKRGLEETVQWFTNSNNLNKYKSDLYNI